MVGLKTKIDRELRNLKFLRTCGLCPLLKPIEVEIPASKRKGEDDMRKRRNPVPISERETRVSGITEVTGMIGMDITALLIPSKKATLDELITDVREISTQKKSWEHKCCMCEKKYATVVLSMVELGINPAVRKVENGVIVVDRSKKAYKYMHVCDSCGQQMLYIKDTTVGQKKYIHNKLTN